MISVQYPGTSLLSIVHQLGSFLQLQLARAAKSRLSCRQPAEPQNIFNFPHQPTKSVLCPVFCKLSQRKASKCRCFNPVHPLSFTADTISPTTKPMKS